MFPFRGLRNGVALNFCPLASYQLTMIDPRQHRIEIMVPDGELQR